MSPSTMMLLSIAFLIALCPESHTQEQTYMVTGPQVWRVGAQETVLVQVFGLNNAMPVKISLRSDPENKVYVEQSLMLKPDNNFQGLARLQILPKDLSGKIQNVILHAQSSIFTKSVKVPVIYENGFLFIQTDKAIYTPDQTVKVRVYSMDEELRPARRRVTLTIKDPEEVKIDVITQDDLTGVVSFPEFKIPANPRFGFWKMEATYESDYSTSTVVKFEVKEYVLPRFFVTIEPESNFISQDTFESFQIDVSAKYYYGRDVERGKAFIRYGIIKDGEKTMMPKSIDVMQMQNGKATFRFNGKRVVKELQYFSLEELDGAYLYITTTVEEAEGAQSEESENSNVKFLLTPYQLKLIATPLFVKPLLPYHIKVLVKDDLGNPVAGIPLALTGEFMQLSGNSASLNDGRSIRQTTSSKGTTVFILNIPKEATALDFKIATEDRKLQEDNQARAEFHATSYNSLTKSYLYIDWARESRVLQVGEYLDVTVHPQSPYLHKLTRYSYLIVSKGKIIQYDTVPRIFQSDSQSLNIPIEPSMVPSFRLLVYYIVTGEGTAELIADSIWVEVQEKCVNKQKVEVKAPGEIFKPKENVTLNMMAQMGSIVALSAVDMAIYDVSKRSQRPMDRVLRKLDESDLGCGAGAGQDNKDVLERAGLTFLTNANIQASGSWGKKCEEQTRSKRSIEDRIKLEADRYKNESVRKCCLDGGDNLIKDNECAKGVERVKKLRPRFTLCAQVFERCCQLAQQLKLKAEQEHKDLNIGRIYIETVLDLEEPEIRSYFPESWLWEEHFIKDRSGSKQQQISLPDSLTAWEIQGIGMSEQGICVADPLRLKVFKDLFLDVQLPYSVVRGEQVQIRVTVYNYQTSKVKGCVRVSVEKSVCLVRDSGSGKAMGCSDDIQPLQPKTYTYTLLPLEIGLHPITFTLNTLRKEIVIKTLRVVAEGIQEKKSAGFTLDPQGIRGITRRTQDVSYKVSPNIVPKSQITRILSVTGNILGEVISVVMDGKGLDTLVSLSKNSAESDLMSVAPIFYVYHYLQIKSEWQLLGSNTFMTQVDLRRKMREGVSSILAFRNRDYSYSLRRDSDPSTWLTAFALRIFGEVSRYVDIDHMSVCNSLIWIAEKCQSSDGSFQEKSSTLPFKLQGSIPRAEEEKKLYLTAYTVIGMRKSFHMCQLAQVDRSLQRAEEYLAKQAPKAQSTLALAISAYALYINKDTPLQYKRQAMGRLQAEAFSIGAGDYPVYRFWKDTLKKVDATVPSEETAMMVETTAYALLAVLKSGDHAYAKPIVSWLTSKQRYGGGFFGTQDTITALEALTEVAILEKKLALNMEVTVNYRKSGHFKTYQLTEKNPFAKPVEVPIPEDLIISTRSAFGVTTGNVRTFYNIISPPQKDCRFDVRIQRRQEQEQSIFDYSSTLPIYLDACAKYKPQGNEDPVSGQAVMEITLVTGLLVDEKYLSEMVNRVDQYVFDYSVEDGKVILHFDWIESTEYTCATVMVRKMFDVAMSSPGALKVYEYRTPDQACMLFYNPFADDNLVRVCAGDACKCLEGECPKMRRLDQTITAEQRKQKACRSDATFAYKVKISQSEEDGDFVKYTATILDIFNKGEALVKAQKQIRLIKKKTCSGMDLESGNQYLVMGKDGIQIRVEREFQYEYPLDSNSWVEWWPDSSCGRIECTRLMGILEDFSEDILLHGCS